MAKFKPYVAEQMMLFPNSIDDYAPEDHLARVNNRAVEQLNTADIEDKYSELGQNIYYPKILIKLLFYGYSISERSGHKISSKCETDTAYIYLGQWLNKIDRKIKDIIEETDQIDADENALYGDRRRDELPEDINTEEKFQKKIQEVMKKFKNDKEKISLMDNDAKFMKVGNSRINVSYNCQVAVTNEQFIIEGDVTTDANDRGALKKIVDSSEDNLGAEMKEVVADAGYSSYDNYE